MANVLGINISTLEPQELWQKIQELIAGQEQNYLVTPNPEIILKSHQDEEFFHVLNKATLSLADGFGLKISGMLLGQRIPRITGADITLKILELAEKNSLKVLIINWNKGMSNQTDIRDSLQEEYPQLKVLIEDGERDSSVAQETVDKINGFEPSIMFCTFGFPYQEKYIYHNLKKTPSVKLALGVGGSFDFITKKSIRAPRPIRWLGLEWLWRLITEPKRAKRIYRATCVFFFKLLKARFIDTLRYRPNVACLLYKKEEGKIKVLLVERSEENNHWQFPQGGTDGERVVKAGHRELSEELNTNKFTTKGSFKNVYKYKFTPETSEGKALESTKAYRFSFRGQTQSLYIAEFTGQKNDIKINFWDHSQFKWVDIADAPNEVHPVRRTATEMFVNKFKSLNIN